MPRKAFVSAGSASTSLAEEIAARIRGSGGVARIATRPGPPDGALDDFDELWYLGDGGALGPGLARDGDDISLAGLGDLLARSRRKGARLNVVLPALGAGADARVRETLQRIEQEIAGQGRVFYVAPSLAAVPGSGLLGVLAEVHGTVRELTARCPAHVASRPLRWPVPPGSAVPVLDSGVAAEALCELALDPAAEGGRYLIAPPSPVPLADLVQDITQAGPAGLVPGDAETDVDRYLASRLQPVIGQLLAPVTAGSDARDGLAAAGIDPARSVPDQRTRQRALAAGWRSLDMESEAAAKRTAQAVGELSHRTAGAALGYLTNESDGPALVLLNALGQGPGFWSRLIGQLSRDHRVITWTPRGTDPGDPVLTVSDQVEDLRRILDAAGVGRAHLIGWCSGPKIALNFSRRYPSSVASLAFIAGSFKLLGHAPELDTDYEHNLASLCMMLQERPAFASRLASMFGGERQEDNPLTAVDPCLEADVRKPFASPDTMVRYAGQLLDFWSDDALTRAAGIPQPVLFLGAELDTITAPARQRAAASRFPRARYAELIGATHYCLHDRAELVAALVADFVADPGRLPRPYPGVRWD